VTRDGAPRGALSGVMPKRAARAASQSNVARSRREAETAREALSFVGPGRLARQPLRRQGDGCDVDVALPFGRPSLPRNSGQPLIQLAESISLPNDSM
jgi:hypothetical protein